MMTKLQRGFTLVELVTVIIVIGILAVSIIPRFDGTDAYEANTHRAQLISALRLTQQRAMQQTSDTFCNHLLIEEKQYGVPDRTDCSIIIFPSSWVPDATGHVVDTRYNITFSTSPKIIGFSSMGRPLNDCAGGCTISVNSEDETLDIIVKSEGYIHAKRL